MSTEQLFVRHEQPALGEIAPSNEVSASPLSEYTLETMPIDLRRLTEGEVRYEDLAAKQEELLTTFSPLIAANQNPQVAKIIQLDLLFMLGGYIAAGEDMYKRVPPPLVALIKQQCGRFSDLPDFMTYDLIIDTNSSEYERTGRMRVFSDGEDGLHERDFYLGHHLAEPYVKTAAYGIRDLAMRPGLYGEEGAVAVLEAAHRNLEVFQDYMARYGKLPVPAFTYFRQFINNYPDGTRNASGAFMPSVQLLELSLKKPSKMQSLFLDESMKYFPAWSQVEIEGWRRSANSGINIEDQLACGALALDDEGRKLLHDVTDMFTRFRKSHVALTRKHIKAAFKDSDTTHSTNDEGELPILTGDSEVLGSAGFNVANVLHNSIERIRGFKERIRD